MSAPMNTDILVWANIAPSKWGSFEEYLAQTAERCRVRGWSLALACGEPIHERLRLKLEKCGARLVPVSIDDLERPQSLTAALAIHRPRLLHMHFIGAGHAMVRAARASWRGRLVQTDHSSVHLHEPLRVSGTRRFKRRLALSLIDRVLPVSDFKAGLYKGLTPPAKCVTIHNGVNVDRFSPLAPDERRAARRALLSVDDDVTVIGFVGQLTRSKGIDRFLQTLAALPASLNIKAVVAGKGGDWRKEASSSPHPVHWLGVRDDLERIFPALDLLVAPARWREAFGLVLAEAASCGLPIVATDVGGIPEVVKTGETGLIVPSGDQMALDHAVLSLTVDPPRRMRMAAAARKHVKASFRLEAMIDRTMDVYAAELEQDGPSGLGARAVALALDLLAWPLAVLPSARPS